MFESVTYIYYLLVNSFKSSKDRLPLLSPIAKLQPDGSIYN